MDSYDSVSCYARHQDTFYALRTSHERNLMVTCVMPNIINISCVNNVFVFTIYMYGNNKSYLSTLCYVLHIYFPIYQLIFWSRFRKTNKGVMHVTHKYVLVTWVMLNIRNALCKQCFPSYNHLKAVFATLHIQISLLGEQYSEDLFRN